MGGGLSFPAAALTLLGPVVSDQRNDECVVVKRLVLESVHQYEYDHAVHLS